MNLKVKIGEEVFEVEVGDLSARPVIATIDGEIFEVWPEEEAVVSAPATVAKAPSGAAAAAPRVAPLAKPAAPAGEVTSNMITAPIPGSIISVAVKPGDKVTKGQELCVLEAMKMKNAIRANRDGQIATVFAAVGQTVQKGAPLVEFSS
jgi:glutaconyl-CoA/methylmalonyl-CoA decarboxylase subunit gamma